MPGEKESACRHLSFTGVQKDGSEIYRCKLLGALFHSADGHECTFINASCLDRGCSQNVSCAFIQERIRKGLRVCVRSGWKWPPHIMESGWKHENAVVEAVPVLGKAQTRFALLDGIRVGLDAAEAQRLIDKYGLEATDAADIGP